MQLQRLKWLFAMIVPSGFYLVEPVLAGKTGVFPEFSPAECAVVTAAA
jgi:hypothetical protein